MADNKVNTALAGLLAVQRDLKAPKNSFNSFGKYKYRSAEDILSAARPLCNENGLILTLSDEVYRIDARFYIEAVATVTDVATGDSFSSHASAREEEAKKGMDSAQVTGATSSYARKYALCGLFAIDDTKDMDSDEYTAKRNTSISPQKAPQSMQTTPMANNTNGANNSGRAKIMDNLKHRVSEMKLNASQMKNIIRDKFHKDSTKDLNDGELETLLINLSMFAAERNY